MFNHHRGLWGYTGIASDGAPLTIQSTGMGGPSAAIVISELADLGACRLIRVGTCGALSPELGLGELLVATEAIAGDGTSQALRDSGGTGARGQRSGRGGAPARVRASPALLSTLMHAATGQSRCGPIVSHDLFYDSREGLEEEWLQAGALAVEMETATLFALAAKRGLQAGALLTVTDLLRPSRVRIGLEQLRECELRMGAIGLAALAMAPVGAGSAANRASGPAGSGTRAG